MKKAGIAELLESAVHECDAEEQANREQRPAQPVGLQLACAIVTDLGFTGSWRTTGSALGRHAQKLGSEDCLFMYRQLRGPNREIIAEDLNSRRPSRFIDRAHAFGSHRECIFLQVPSKIALRTR